MIQYIVLGNGLDWCELSFHGIDKRSDILFFNSKLPLKMHDITAKIARYYFSNTLNRKFELPFKSLWYPALYKKMQLNKNARQVLIIYDKNMLGCNTGFLLDVKKQYPNLKLVYAFTNIVKFSGAKINNFLHKLNDYYDVVLAFDKLDAEKYHFDYSPLVYNCDKRYTNMHNETQVFYIGTAKDRLDDLVKVYKRLIDLGIKCDFNIAEVDKDKCEEKSGIIYNIRRPYAEVLEHIAKADCLLDVIQGESSGLTIKVCEAVCYDKKLITTNTHVAEYPFFNPEYIRVINSPSDITRDFFDNKKVHYRNEDKEYFSTDAFLGRINDMLNSHGEEG